MKRENRKINAELAGFTFTLHFLFLSASVQATPINLIQNGDFSLGNIGFSSQYSYSATDTTPGGSYTVSTDPNLTHSAAMSFGDHTTGSGNMLVANGTTVPGLYVWAQTILVAADTDYTFSGWAASWGQYGNGIDTDPARLLFLADDIQFGGIFTVTQQNGIWTEFVYGFNSGSSTSITLKIVNQNLAYAPNDFSLDDLSLTSPSVIPLPATAPMMLTGLVILGAMVRRRTRVPGQCTQQRQQDM